MNPNDLARFNQAIALSQAGQKPQAYSILSQLAQSYPTDSNILLWMAFSSGNLRESRQLLDRVAQIDPQNATLPGAQEWLAQEEQKLAVVAAPVMTAPALPAAPPPAAEKKSWRNRKESTDLPKPDPAAAATPDGVVPKPPEEPVEKASWLFSSAAIIGGIVLLAGILFVLFNTIFLGDKLAAKGIPVYANATRLELDQRDKDIIDAYTKVMGTSTDGKLKELALEIYKVKKTELSKAAQYYESELKKQGWVGKSVGTGANTAVIYIKDNNKVLILNSTPTTTLHGNYPLGADEIMLVAVYVEANTGLF